jgi:hypothetical protein
VNSGGDDFDSSVVVDGCIVLVSTEVLFGSVDVVSTEVVPGGVDDD